MEVANLREAAWMILLAPEAEKVFLSADYFPIPEGMIPMLPDSDGVGRGFGIGGNSGQTQLGWSWVTADGLVLASGTLTWPSSYEAPESHAADLLRIAELGWRSECPPAMLPAFAPEPLHSGVSAIDARPLELTALQGELATTLRGYASSLTCLTPGE